VRTPVKQPDISRPGPYGRHKYSDKRTIIKLKGLSLRLSPLF
jgi:hypothetical protein